MKLDGQASLGTRYKLESCPAITALNPAPRLPDSSISMMFDRYGPLFRRADDVKELDAAEKSLLA